ncbi:MAG: hypothetical protein AAFV29_21040 [Myxococcota bacterium]
MASGLPKLTSWPYQSDLDLRLTALTGVDLHDALPFSVHFVGFAA